MGRRMKRLQLESAVITHAEPATTQLEPDTDRTKRIIEMISHRQRRAREYTSLSDQVAGDKFYYTSHYWTECKEDFPGDPSMQYVDKYYPWADGGALLLDEPQYDYEIEGCKVKAKVMLMHRYRYVYITPRMTLEEAQEQLEKHDVMVDSKNKSSNTAQ
jgi:hypothetical protein